ncbi:MAG TPA: hypothetical protein PK280_18245 [Planctomycetota bacterium]|nr:hypothetical protein [Planctomycetota bacterium]
MELIYCSKCGKMIPPGGPDEGKRYLRSGEPICPKCYQKAPDEERTGGTLMVSEGVAPRPTTSAHRQKDETKTLRRPRTSQMNIPALGKTPATKLVAAARPSEPSGRRGSTAVLWGLGAGLVLLVVPVIWFLAGSGGRPGALPQPTPTGEAQRVPSVGPTVDLRRPLAHWTFDRINGATVPDVSGRGHDGKIAGSVQPVEGRLGSALQFSAPGGTVEVPSAPELELGRENGNFSVSFWLFMEKEWEAGAGYRGLFRRGTLEQDRTLSLWLCKDSDRIYYRVSTFSNSDAGGTSEAAVQARRWTHVGCVKSGDSLSLYLDGRRDSEAKLPGPVLANSGPLRLGANSGYPSPACRIDDLRIYGSALNDKDMATLAAGRELDGATAGPAVPPVPATPVAPPALTASGAGAFAEKDGLVVMEAENFSACQPGTGAGAVAGWARVTVPSGFVGAGALQALPADRKVYLRDEQTGARLDYRVAFPKAGSYRIWVRMAMGPDECDTVFVGLDGKPPENSQTLRGISSKWQWTGTEGRNIPTVRVPGAGVHVLNLWVRESRLAIDRIILAADPAYTPAEPGPEESPRAADAAPPKGPETGPTVSAGPGAVWLTEVLQGTQHIGHGEVSFEEQVVVDGKTYDKCLSVKLAQANTLAYLVRLDGRYSALEFSTAELGAPRPGSYEFQVTADGKDSLFKQKTGGGLQRIDLTGLKQIYIKVYAGFGVTPEARAVYLSPRLIRAGEELPAAGKPEAGADAVWMTSLLPAARKASPNFPVGLDAAVRANDRDWEHCLVMRPPPESSFSMSVSLKEPYSTLEFSTVVLDAGKEPAVKFTIADPGGKLLYSSDKDGPGPQRISVAGLTKISLSCYMPPGLPADARGVWLSPRLVKAPAEPPKAK